MEYEVLSIETLYDILKQNMHAIAGAIRELVGEDKMPDARELVEMFDKISAHEYLEALLHQKNKFAGTMDIQEMMAQISRENVDIHRELLKRIS